jgi:hypothetical protein
MYIPRDRDSSRYKKKNKKEREKTETIYRRVWLISAVRDRKGEAILSLEMSGKNQGD